MDRPPTAVPPTGSVFANKGDFIAAATDAATSQGFKLWVGEGKINGGGGALDGRLELLCSQFRIKSPQGKKTRVGGCRFLIKGRQKLDGQWEVINCNNQHNHPMHNVDLHKRQVSEMTVQKRRKTRQATDSAERNSVHVFERPTSVLHPLESPATPTDNAHLPPVHHRRQNIQHQHPGLPPPPPVPPSHHHHHHHHPHISHHPHDVVVPSSTFMEASGHFNFYPSHPSSLVAGANINNPYGVQSSIHHPSAHSSTAPASHIVDRSHPQGLTPAVYTFSNPAQNSRLHLDPRSSSSSSPTSAANPLHSRSAFSSSAYRPPPGSPPSPHQLDLKRSPSAANPEHRGDPPPSAVQPSSLSRSNHHHDPPSHTSTPTPITPASANPFVSGGAIPFDGDGHHQSMSGFLRSVDPELEQYAPAFHQMGCRSVSKLFELGYDEITSLVFDDLPRIVPGIGDKPFLLRLLRSHISQLQAIKRNQGVESHQQALRKE